MKRRWKQMIPVICIMAIMAGISVCVYEKVIEREEYRCWQILNDAAESVSREVTAKFEDEIQMLHLVADMMLDEEGLNEKKIYALDVVKYQPTSIFTGIALLYPDNSIIADNGKHIGNQIMYSFSEIAARGEHISARCTEIETGKDIVYYSIPLEYNGEIQALLMGVIDLKRLTEIFVPTIYNGQAHCCIVDSSDGNFIMDSWHEELGNLFDMQQRKLLEGYEHIDLKEEIRNGNTGVIAFESKTTGKGLYMYYMPLELFDWQLEIFIQEDEIFEALLYLKQILWKAGIAEIFVLAAYLVWNIMVIEQLEKSKAESEQQKEQLKILSYKDMLTSLYNRNKYIDMLQSNRKGILQRTGVGYIDLNGLKQINDSHSHDAGDIFIKSTGGLIGSVFTEEAYRIGGDEFVIIATDIEEEVFQNKVSLLRELLDKENVSVSVGFLWKESCDSLEVMLREAEKEMYKEKESYYQTHSRYEACSHS